MPLTMRRVHEKRMSTIQSEPTHLNHNKPSSGGGVGFATMCRLFRKLLFKQSTHVTTTETGPAMGSLKHLAHKILGAAGERVVLLGPLQLIAVFFVKGPRLKI